MLVPMQCACESIAIAWPVPSGSLCVLGGEEGAIVTKYVLVNGTYAHISMEMGRARRHVSVGESHACAETKLSVVVYLEVQLRDVCTVAAGGW